MRVFGLDCPKCGAPLKVAENKTQIVCVFCGSTLRVERDGGALSLELGGIRRGTDKTAAELALVRLRTECGGSSLRVEGLRYQIRQVTSQLAEPFNKAAILSATEATRLKAQVQELRTFASQGGGLTGLLVGTGALVSILFTFGGGCSMPRPSDILPVMFRWVVVIALVWVAVGVGSWLFVAKPRQEASEAADAIAKDLLRHDAMVATATVRRNLEAQLEELNRELPEAEADLARIEAEIQRNRAIIAS